MLQESSEAPGAGSGRGEPAEAENAQCGGRMRAEKGFAVARCWEVRPSQLESTLRCLLDQPFLSPCGSCCFAISEPPGHRAPLIPAFSSQFGREIVPPKLLIIRG